MSPKTAGTGWEQRFLSSTRGRLVTLLRRSARTVDELAHELGLTDNAVRAHLATLERDGLVASRPGQGTFVTKAAHAMPVTAETALRRSLERWIRSAKEAGLDTENIRAIVATTLQESEEKVRVR